MPDEVYEDYVYRGEHVSLARFAPERTLSAFSFAKAYGMAGNRTGTWSVLPRS
jgi:aspartate/methionine/tyrosine aminotransferase